MMIELKNIQKSYPVGKERFTALKDINLTVDTGELLAIQGRSGAGKSTLFNIIGCLDDFDQGEYLLNGELISAKRDKELARLRSEQIGFVLQEFALLDHQPVLFNVMLPMYFDNTPYSVMKQKATEALAQVQMHDHKDKLANKLSGGERQRVAIARAIVNDPMILLADEPTGALDTETANEIMNLLVTLHANGLTVLIITHDEEVAAYCPRRIQLLDGRIQTDVSVSIIPDKVQ